MFNEFNRYLGVKIGLEALPLGANFEAAFSYPARLFGFILYELQPLCNTSDLSTLPYNTIYIRCITRHILASNPANAPFRFPILTTALVVTCAMAVQVLFEALVFGLCLSMLLYLALLDATFDLYNGTHLLLGDSDSFGPPPRRDPALVQLIDFGSGTTTHVRLRVSFLKKCCGG